MSWDFSMYVDNNDGPGELDYDANYTYNVAPMFVRAFQDDDGIRILHGVKGRVCRALLKIAITNMEDSPEAYEAMNPKNGWGDYAGALALLRQLLDWSTRAPGARMRVS